jgi:hypothetical protein
MNYPNPAYNPAQQYPVQPPAQQPQYPAYPPAQGYPPQAAPQYPQQAYPPAAPQQPPTPPLAKGSIDDFYNQPSVGGGPSVAWTDKQGSPKPIGTVYAGIVARDVTDADIQQQTDFKTQMPLTYRDGRPKFAMKVPLKVQPSQEHPEGDASWYVKGQARDELVRAMSEAGVSGTPKAGDAIAITLVQRRPSGPGMNPANIVQVQYQPAGSGQGAPTAPAPQPVQQQAPVQQFVQEPQAPAQPQYQPPAQQYEQQPQAPVQQYAQPTQQAPVQQFQQPQGQPAPVQQAGPQPPADMSPEQAALLARLTNQNGQQVA